MKATLKFLIERVESIFGDSLMIELDLNDHKSKLTKVVVLSLIWMHPVLVMTGGLGTQSYRYLINISPINELVRHLPSLFTQSDCLPQKDWVPSQTETQSDWVTNRTGTQLDWTGAYLVLGIYSLCDNICPFYLNVVF